MRLCPCCGYAELSERQKIILIWVGRAGAYSRDISKRLKISISNASNQLKKMESIGLLEREFHPQNSGGWESFWKKKPFKRSVHP